MKTKSWRGAGVGGTVGGCIPYFWGNYSFLSFSSLILSAIGGIIGIWAGYQLGKMFGV
jgi:hypothetical protein